MPLEDDLKSGKISVRQLMDNMRKQKAEAQNDVLDERLQMMPTVKESGNNITYEDPWIKVSMIQTENGYSLEWTRIKKTGETKEIREYSEIKSKEKAYTTLRDHIFDYWTAGTLHPICLRFADTEFTPPHVYNLFKK